MTVPYSVSQTFWTSVVSDSASITDVLKVPGGLIYRTRCYRDDTVAMVFVPEVAP